MNVMTLLPSHEAMFRWDAPRIEQSPMTSVKVLWVGSESGAWATLALWKAGFVANRHKHLAGRPRLRGFRQDAEWRRHSVRG